MLEIKVFSIPYEKHFSAIFIRFSRSCSDFDEFLLLISFIPTWMTTLPKFPFSIVGSSQWYNSFKLHPGNILNCADPFPGIWLNCLCHIPFGMLSPKMIVFTFLVCFLPVVIVATYDAFAGTTFLFAKPACFSGWLLITTWRRLADFGITDWFLKKFLSSGRVKNSFSVAGSSMQ